MGVFERTMRGRTDFVADFYDRLGRHQLGFATRAEAYLHFATYDIRVRDDQTLADWVRYYRAHLPPMTEKLARNTGLCLGKCLEVILTPPDPSAATDRERLDIRAVPIRNVTFRHIEKIYLAARSRRRPATVENWMVALEGCLGQAVLEGRIDHNPVSTFRSFPENRLKRRVAVPDLPFPSDYPAIRAGLSQSGRIGFGLLTEVGLTSLEAAALQWRDVNMAGRTVSIRNAYDPRTNAIVPCGNPASVRVVGDIAPEFMARLAAHKARSAGFGNDYVLNFEASGKVLTRTMVPRRLRTELLAAQRSAGIASPRTGLPYRTEDFRDRWVVDRLNDPSNHNYVRTQASAGYANVNAFAARYQGRIDADDSHEQIELALGALAVLTGRPPVSGP